MTLHDVLRAIVRSDGSLLNDARWVENAVRAIAAHEAKYPSPVVAATPDPDPRDAEIAQLKAELAARAQAPAEPDPRDAEIAALKAELAQADGSPG